MKTFIFIACIIATAMAAPYGDFTPPVSGTWIINTTTRVEGDHTINGDVEVTADLIIVGATLTHDGPSGFNYTWTVSNDASVSINGSTLTVPDESDGAWSLTTEASDASLIIETSTLIFGDTTHGVSTGAKDIYIVGSTLQHGANGVANLTSTENFNHEKGWTLLMLAHTSDEALLNTSSAVIIDTVIRTAVPFEEEPDHEDYNDHHDNAYADADDDADDDDDDDDDWEPWHEQKVCDWSFADSYCDAVEELEMSAFSLVGSIHGVGRSHVSISGTSVLPLGLYLYSGDDEKVFGTVSISDSLLWEMTITNAERVDIDELTIFNQAYLERTIDLNEDEVAKTNLTMSDSTFAPDNCAELKVDYGVIGRIDDSQFANPAVTGYLWRYGPEGQFGWADHRRRSGDAPPHPEEWDDEDWDDEDWDDEDWDEYHEESHECMWIDDDLVVCNTDFTGDFCNAPWFWALVLAALLSLCCGLCVCCFSFCCLLHCLRSICGMKRKQPGETGGQSWDCPPPPCCNPNAAWRTGQLNCCESKPYGGRAAAPGDSAVPALEGSGSGSGSAIGGSSMAAPPPAYVPDDGPSAPPPAPRAPSTSSNEKGSPVYPSL